MKQSKKKKNSKKKGNNLIVILKAEDIEKYLQRVSAYRGRQY